MAAGTVHQTRHFKTLIVLVVAMTSGTFLLFWIASFSPVTPLRGQTTSAAGWTEIVVRAKDVRDQPGFFHYRIDDSGRLFQSHAWKARRSEFGRRGTIQILLSCQSPELRITPDQASTLSHIISDLRRNHGIPVNKVSVEHPEIVSSSLRRT